MATRTALLNGNVINRDTDFSKYLETVSGEGVIEGLAVSASSVAIGKCWVKCERTNGDIILALVYNNSVQEISGDGDVYVEIPQEIIDNGELGNEDGSEIAEIKVGTLPSKNALLLATITSGVVEDKRNIIHKTSEINTINGELEIFDDRITAIEDSVAKARLEEDLCVGELYTASDNLCLIHTPKQEDSLKVAYAIGDNTARYRLHIQRIASGTPTNTLKLLLRNTGNPTTHLICEIQKGVPVEVSSTEIGWYGDGEAIATGYVEYSNMNKSFQEITFTFDNNFGGTRGELLDIVIYQTVSTTAGGTPIVNTTDYYELGIDGTQYSEAYRLVVENNSSTMTYTKLMPYVDCDGFEKVVIAKKKTTNYSVSAVFENSQYFSGSTSSGYSSIQCSPTSLAVNTTLLRWKISYGNTQLEPTMKVGSATIFDRNRSITQGETSKASGDNISFYGYKNSGGSNNRSLTLTFYYYITETKNIPFKNMLPDILTQTVKGVGQINTAILFGLVDKDLWRDGGYKGGIDGTKSTSATTGSISLGNAVGFMNMNINGEIVKIPYYK